MSVKWNRRRRSASRFLLLSRKNSILKTAYSTIQNLEAGASRVKTSILAVTKKSFSCQRRTSRRKYQFSSDHWNKGAWTQPVFCRIISYGEWRVQLLSNQGVNPFGSESLQHKPINNDRIIGWLSAWMSWHICPHHSMWKYLSSPSQSAHIEAFFVIKTFTGREKP